MTRAAQVGTYPTLVSVAVEAEHSGETPTCALKVGGEVVRSKYNISRRFSQTTLELARINLLTQFTQSILALGDSLIGMWLAEVLAALAERAPLILFCSMSKTFSKLQSATGARFLAPPRNTGADLLGEGLVDDRCLIRNHLAWHKHS